MNDNYEMIRKWIEQESDRLDRIYPGIRVTGGMVRARKINGVAMITGVDFDAVRDGVELVIHTESNGGMKNLTVMGFSGGA